MRILIIPGGLSSRDFEEAFLSNGLELDPEDAGEVRSTCLDMQIPAKKLLYSGAHTERPEKAFMASNEYTLHMAEQDRSPAQIFVGVGANAMWDYAMRRGAQYLVVVDQSIEVLRAHHLLYEPLLRVCANRAEFLSAVAVVPIPTDDPSETGAIFDRIATKLARQGRTAYDSDSIEERREFARQTEVKVALSPDNSEEQIRFVSAYLNWMIQPFHYPAYMAAPFSTECVMRAAHIFSQLSSRYSPHELRAMGADTTLINDPHFSVFASEEAYQWLRWIYTNDRVRYCHADLTDLELYPQIAAFSARLGKSIDGFYLSNALSIDAEGEEALRIKLERFGIDRSIRNLFPVGDTGLAIYYTRGRKEHEQGQFKLN